MNKEEEFLIFLDKLEKLTQEYFEKSELRDDWITYHAALEQTKFIKKRFLEIKCR